MTEIAPGSRPAAAEVSLRALRWWDLSAVIELEQQLFTDTAWSLAQFWSELAYVPETRWYTLAEVNAVPVGYAGLFQVGREAEVQTVAVAPRWQGKGIGRTLVEALVSAATRRSSRVLHLEVEAGNQSARNLYSSCGFEEVGRRRAYYGPQRDAVLMTRTLAQSEGVGNA